MCVCNRFSMNSCMSGSVWHRHIYNAWLEFFIEIFSIFSHLQSTVFFFYDAQTTNHSFSMIAEYRCCSYWLSTHAYRKKNNNMKIFFSTRSYIVTHRRCQLFAKMFAVTCFLEWETRVGTKAWIQKKNTVSWTFTFIRRLPINLRIHSFIFLHSYYTVSMFTWSAHWFFSSSSSSFLFHRFIGKQSENTKPDIVNERSCSEKQPYTRL